LLWWPSHEAALQQLSSLVSNLLSQLDTLQPGDHLLLMSPTHSPTHPPTHPTHPRTQPAMCLPMHPLSHCWSDTL
jgi:hypothetical protein